MAPSNQPTNTPPTAPTGPTIATSKTQTGTSQPTGRMYFNASLSLSTTVVTIASKEAKNNTVTDNDVFESELNTAGTIISIGAISVSTTIAIVARIYYYCRIKISNYRGIDKPKYMFLFRFAAAFIDFWTDIIFSLILLFSDDNVIIVLGYWSLAATCVPYFCSLIIYCAFVTSWRRNDKRLKQYFSKYEGLILISSLIAGFYSTIYFFHSQIFFHELFYLGLHEKHRNTLFHLKFANIIIFEVCLYNDKN